MVCGSTTSFWRNFQRKPERNEEERKRYLAGLFSNAVFYLMLGRYTLHPAIDPKDSDVIDFMKAVREEILPRARAADKNLPPDLGGLEVDQLTYILFVTKHPAFLKLLKKYKDID
jgi:hypothetical protein